MRTKAVLGVTTCVSALLIATAPAGATSLAGANGPPPQAESSDQAKLTKAERRKMRAEARRRARAEREAQVRGERSAEVVVDDRAGDALVTAANDQDIVVVGIRGSVASAANMKRTSKQIVDSVVSEDVGKLPDNNVPEALSRVTGVQIYRARGSGQGVTIRGLSDIQTTINGNQTNLGEGRALDLADIPAELLKSVDVYKTRTADQVEGGIAGTVNVELRRPLDLKNGLTVAGSVRGVYDDIAKNASPYGSLLIGDRLQTGIGEVGFLVNASYTRTNYFENYIQSESPEEVCCDGDPDTPRAGLPANLQNIVIPYRAYYGVERGNVKRPSLNAVLQWKPNEKLDFVLEGGYLGSREKRSIERLYVLTRETGTEFNNIKLAPDGRTVQSLTVTNPDLLAGIDSLLQDLRSNLYTTNFEAHWRSDRAQINASVQYNWSKTTNNFIEQILKPGPLTTANVSFVSDQYPGGVPSISFPANNLADLTSYGVDRFQDNVYGADNKEFAAQADLTLKLSEQSFLRSLQTGVRLNKRIVSNHYGYRDGYPRIGGQPSPLTAFPGGGQAGLVSLRIGGIDTPEWYRIPGQIIADNLDAVRGYIQANDPDNAERFSTAVPPSDLGSTYSAHENNFAAYAQLNYGFKLGFPIDGVLGVRYTNTWGDSTSFNFRPGNQNNDFQDIVQNASGRGNYADILPSITALIHFTPKAQLRMSFTTNVTRPSFFDTRPFFYAETRANPPIIYAGNPNLKAQREHSFDASAEYYFGRAGSVTLAGYYKKATGFLYDSFEEGDLARYGLAGTGFIEQVRNAGDGTFAGVEGQLQSFFDFMPGFFKNFGASVNASYILKARIEYPYPEDFPGAFDSPDTSKWTANAALYYDTPSFSARVAYNFRSSYRNYAFSNNPAYSPYTGNTQRLDAAINYTPVKFMTLSLEGGNLLGDDDYEYFGQGRLLPKGVRTLARTVQGSIRFRF